MSYEKHVYASRLPDDLVNVWLGELNRHGMEVEFHPEFKLSTWQGGYLPCKLVVQPEAFPDAARYGQRLQRSWEADPETADSAWDIRAFDGWEE